MRFMVAASIPEGAIVNMPAFPEFYIDVVENSTPRPGLITWLDPDDNSFEVGGAQVIEVVSLP